jgi:hypothetical protein
MVLIVPDGESARAAYAAADVFAQVTAEAAEMAAVSKAPFHVERTTGKGL